MKIRALAVMSAVVGAALLIGSDPSLAQEPPWGTRVRSREVLLQERLEALDQRRGPLRALLKKMPKGADLHSHLSGAVQTERLIAWGAEDGLCVSTATFTATPPPCDGGQVPLAEALSDPILYDHVLRAWSMEGFQGALLEAHQHFFDTFGKFGAVLSDARIQVLKNMVRNSLEHSFVPGKSLWKVPSHYDQPTDACADDEPGHPRPSSTCARLLARSARAALQWRLEAAFHFFEHSLLTGREPPAGPP